MMQESKIWLLVGMLLDLETGKTVVVDTYSKRFRDVFLKDRQKESRIIKRF